MMPMSPLALRAALRADTRAPSPVLSMKDTWAMCSARRTLPWEIASVICCLKVGAAAASRRPSC